MASCKQCNKSCGFFELKGGLCSSCQDSNITKESNALARSLYDGSQRALAEGNIPFALSEMQEILDSFPETEEADLVREIHRDQKAKAEASEARLKAVILTTETVTNLDISERLGIITAECVYGMNIFKDIFAGVRDVVGGRSVATQNVLKDARKEVLTELKKEAFDVGANAVVAVDLNYSEFSGGGKSMLLVVASGTAVRLKEGPDS